MLELERIIKNIIRQLLNYGYLPFEISCELCNEFGFNQEQLDFIIHDIVKENSNVKHSIFHSVES